MTPAELFSHLGEANFKEKFLSLPADTMKKLMAEAKLSTARLPSHTSTRKRNEDWSKKLWNSNDLNKVATGLLYVWLSSCQKPLLCAFLDRIGVTHQQGLTDDDFLSQVDEQLLLSAATELLLLRLQEELRP